MELTTEAPDLRGGDGRVFRASAWPSLVASLVCFGIVGGAAAGLSRAGGLPWFAWLVLGPILLVGPPLTLLLAFTFWNDFRALLRDTNWLACVYGDKVVLNLRDGRNAHLGGDDPTVVVLPFAELSCVGQVVETRTDTSHDGPVRVLTRTVELTLNDERATEELEVACFLERTREPPTTKRFGVSTRGRNHNVPVFVSAPGRVRIVWKRGLFDALARHLAEVPEREVDLDAVVSEPDERARELLLRGERLGAVRALRDAGWGLADAKAWVDEERKRAG